MLLIVRRVEALGKFLDTEDGKNLLAGYKRATNIMRIEEKKDAREYVGTPDPSLYRQDEEWALAAGDRRRQGGSSRPRSREDFDAAMRAMAKLRPHVDAFFDKVTVNVDDKPTAREPAQAAQRNPRGDPRGRGFSAIEAGRRHGRVSAYPVSRDVGRRQVRVVELNALIARLRDKSVTYAVDVTE